MGLGPPVCQHCQVFAVYTEDPVPIVYNTNTKTVTKWTHYYCPICRETDITDSAGMDYKQWAKYEQNEKFYKFILNKEKL